MPVKRGPRPSGDCAATVTERTRKFKAAKREKRLRCLAVLDIETDPFTDGDVAIYPFCAELYSDQFGSVVIWEEDHDTFVEKLVAAIEALPDDYIIYAHNGGKFDFMFLLHKLRGKVRFKGRALMSARIGRHEMRDSLHILPEKLAAWKKERFDYSKMLKGHRRKFRAEILNYLHSDCVYLFDFIKRFTREFGLKISIGQAAFTALKKHYKISPIKDYTRVTMDGVVVPGDSDLRKYFLGGRVECIAGSGLFESRKRHAPYRLFDVNSMYPYVMAARAHPVSPNYVQRKGDVSGDTVFIDVTATSYGALFRRSDTGERKLEIVDGERGRFQTTIWEYQTGLRLGWIEDPDVHWCVDNADRTDFRDFVVPMYRRRQECKEILAAQCGSETELEEIKKEAIFLKYLLNNAYGKCAQNPRNYKEYFYSDHGVKPPSDWFDFLHADHCNCDVCHAGRYPLEQRAAFDVWQRPSPGQRFNNVGTAASITGAARAILMEAIANADDPIYCDTDSLICRNLRGMSIDVAALGAWKIEETFDDVIVAGRKTYCCRVAGKKDCEPERLKVRSKGADMRCYPLDRWGLRATEAGADLWQAANAATWQRYLDLLDDRVVTLTNAAPTFTKLGDQFYMRRKIRATAPVRERTYGDRFTQGIVSHRAATISGSGQS